ncbi:MAG: DUF3800 domain-containing protein [Anaerolineales bacterium]|nr:DUF3800 domain-containing protein [Anaerolineales bacterium]
MITFTFAGDESGDTSFNFEKGASRYFVITVIATPSPEDLRDLLEKLRHESGLAQNYEFGFRKLSAERLRNRVFTALSQADFDAWAILVDKAKLAEAYKGMSGLDFYLYFVTELIARIPSEKRAGGTLILDQYGYPDQTKEELKRILKARNIAHGFRRISIRRSQSEPLIQIADLIAGAIWRRDTHNDTGAYETIERKIKKMLLYGN